MDGRLSNVQIQTPHVDWDNVHVSCPSCESHLRLEIDLTKESKDQFCLKTDASINCSSGSLKKSLGNLPHASNNSLLNIVSITGDRLLQSTDTSSFNNNSNTNSAIKSASGQEDHDTSLNCVYYPDSINRLLFQQQSQITSTGGMSNSHHHRKNDLHNPHIATGSQVSHHPTLGSHDMPSKSSREVKSTEAPVPLVKSESTTHAFDLRTQSSPSSPEVLRFKCEMNGCGQSFTSGQQLDLHYKQHRGEKIQKCDWIECNRLFSSKEKLRNHIRCRHTGERPFKCQDCTKAFTSPKHLKDHRLLHTDERPFECEWPSCGLRFRRRHHLVAHKRVHTKERPYGCQFPGCGMKFTKTHHVKRHYETHFKYKSQVPSGQVSPPTSSGSSPPDNSHPAAANSTQHPHAPISLQTQHLSLNHVPSVSSSLATNPLMSGHLSGYMFI